MTSTRRGNSSGLAFERLCVDMLLGIFPDGIPQHSPGWVGLFGQKIRVDFYCDEMCFEFVWQSSRGTTEQKLPYRVLQAKQCHKDERGMVPTVMVIGGRGYTDGAMDWVLSQSGDNLTVMTPDSFMAWVVSEREARGLV